MWQIPQTKSFLSGTSGSTVGGCRIGHVIVASVAGATISFYDGVDNTGVLKLTAIVGANNTIPIPLGRGIEFNAGLFWSSTAAAFVTIQGDGNLGGSE